MTSTPSVADAWVAMARKSPFVGTDTSGLRTRQVDQEVPILSLTCRGRRHCQHSIFSKKPGSIIGHASERPRSYRSHGWWCLTVTFVTSRLHAWLSPGRRLVDWPKESRMPGSAGPVQLDAAVNLWYLDGTSGRSAAW